MATSIRMVPLKGTFGRMARLCRDLGQKHLARATAIQVRHDDHLHAEAESALRMIRRDPEVLDSCERTGIRLTHRFTCKATT